MVITAKFPSRCTTCGTSIAIGTKINWERGSPASHVTCPAKAGTAVTTGTGARKPDVLYNAAGPASDSAPAGAKTRVRTNAKGDDCIVCGDWVEPGKGEIWWGEDGCCSNPRHFDNGGWHVQHLNKDACAKAAAEAKAAHANAKAAKAAKDAGAKRGRAFRDAELKADEAAATAGLVFAGISLPFAATLDAKPAMVCGYSEPYPSHRYYRVERGTLWGHPVIVRNYGGYDDYRSDFYSTREVVEAAWLAWAADVSMTPEKARAWLATSSGCVGTAAYKFIAGSESV